MLKIILPLILLCSNAFAETFLTEKNLIGKYDMDGVVHLKANILPKNKMKATQIGIIYDTECTGTYKYNVKTAELEAKLNCDGDNLYQKISLKDKTLEDLVAGTSVNVYLEYNSEKYNFDFNIIKE